MAEFGMFGSSPSYWNWEEYLRPSSRSTSLTLADLYSPSSRPQYPEPPKPLESFGELGPEAQRAMRREAILRAAMAFGGDPGRIGTNLAAAAGSMSGWQDEQLEAARQRQERDYALSARQAEFAADREKYDREDAERKIQATGALQAVQAIIDGEPEWGARAEAAAREGRYQDLNDMLKRLPERRWMREQGMDPDDPLAEERMKARMKTDAEREHEEWLRSKGLGRYYDEPEPTLEEIEAKSAAAARGSRSVWGGRAGEGPDHGKIMDFGDQPYAVRFDEQGNPSASLVPGAPPPKESWTLIKDEETGTAYYASPSGATRPVPPPPKPLDWTLGYVQQNLGRPLSAKERGEVEKKWREGVKPGLIVHQMKGPKPPSPGAPSQGQVRRPQPKGDAALPPPLRRKAVSDEDKRKMREAVERRFPNLTPEERERKYREALRLLEQGG